MNEMMLGLILTLIAGVATGFGSLVVLFSKKTDTRFLSVCLSFAAGVMMYVAFAEILLEAFKDLKEGFGDGTGYLIATIAFFAGITIMTAVDKLLPHGDGDDVTELENGKALKRTGIMSAVALGVHNFPEGIIVFIAAVHEPAMGIAITIAIIIHNIPEAIAMAAPIYYATGSKAKAFLISLGAGLVQPVGALTAWFFLQNIFDDIENVFGISFAVVAGIMVFVAVHQLLPTAHKFGKHHLVMKWLFAGMAVMAAGLVILEFVL
jgi:ZIP family zinc transporter